MISMARFLLGPTVSSHPYGRFSRYKQGDVDPGTWPFQPVLETTPWGHEQNTASRKWPWPKQEICFPVQKTIYNKSFSSFLGNTGDYEKQQKTV